MRNNFFNLLFGDTHGTVFTTSTALYGEWDWQLAPGLSLAHALSESIKLYATASRGFKRGGYNIRANTAAAPASGRPFEDEVLDSFELGAKMIFGSLELDTAAFYNKYKNVQLSIFTA